MGAGSSPPINPLTDGKAGKSSVALLVLGGVCFVVFVGLDTVQFVLTGHESSLFSAVARAAGGVSIAGVIGTLLTSYLKKRS